MASRVCITTADSQHKQAAESVTMYRVNYLPPEQMPSHQRDFPREGQHIEMAGLDGSRRLGLLVLCYLVAIFAGIGLVGIFADNAITATASVGAIVGR